MNHPTVTLTLTERVDSLAGLLGPTSVAGAIALLEALGGLARRRQAADAAGLRERLDGLLQRARGDAAVELVRGALASVGTDDLERALGDLEQLPSDEDAPLELLARREALEAVVAGVHAAGLADDLGPELTRLTRGLQRVDRLGESMVRRFLAHNETRRAMLEQLDPAARSGWWWSLRAGCDPHALAGLAGGLLQERERAPLVAHLQGCSHCQREMEWHGRVDLLLGAGVEGHPATAQLSAYAAGELDAVARQALAEHLAECPACETLVRAAAAGLAEAERVEQGLALLEAESGRSEEVQAPVIHLPLPIASVAARALAAEPAVVDEAPLPEDRRVLIEEPDRFRLVYYVAAGRGQLGLFVATTDPVALAAVLDDDRLAPAAEEPGLVLFDLGAAAQLPGRTLAVTLSYQGSSQRHSWTFVEETP